MKIRDYFGENFEEEEVQIERHLYKYGNRLMLGLIGVYDGEREPYATLTVNLENEENVDVNEAFVDVNNLTDARGFIERYGLGVPTGRIARSGYCEYPLYRFDLEKIDKLEQEGRKNK